MYKSKIISFSGRREKKKRKRKEKYRNFLSFRLEKKSLDFSDRANRSIFLRGKRLEAAEIRGCLALEKLTGLPGERRARRGVTCRILRASRPSISPLTDSRFFFYLFNGSPCSPFPSFLFLSPPLSRIINIIVVYSHSINTKNANIELSLSYFLSIHLKEIWQNSRFDSWSNS